MLTYQSGFSFVNSPSSYIALNLRARLSGFGYQVGKAYDLCVHEILP